MGLNRKRQRCHWIALWIPFKKAAAKLSWNSTRSLNVMKEVLGMRIRTTLNVYTRGVPKDLRSANHLVVSGVLTGPIQDLTI
jgi:hypothetical protein